MVKPQFSKANEIRSYYRILNDFYSKSGIMRLLILLFGQGDFTMMKKCIDFAKANNSPILNHHRRSGLSRNEINLPDN